MDENINIKQKLPPFVRHFKASIEQNAKKYALGDKKELNSKTCYYCDANHFNKLRWYIHPHTECRTRIHQEKQKERNIENNLGNANDDNQANDVNEVNNIDEFNEDEAGSNNLEAMLVTALNAADGNDTLCNILATSIQSIQE